MSSANGGPHVKFALLLRVHTVTTRCYWFSGGADSYSQGGPGYTLYSAYSGAVLVAGGSGISYIMSILDDMLQKHANGKSHVRVIEVIWSVMDLGKNANSRMFRSLDPLELTGATCQIRYTLCSPSSRH
jgi:hypothetical protein